MTKVKGSTEERRLKPRSDRPTDYELKAAFHRGWGRAKDEGYVKREWMNLQLMLNRRGILV